MGSKDQVKNVADVSNVSSVQKNERWYQEKILNFLNESSKMKEILEKDDLKIDKEIPVPYRVSFLQKNGKNVIETYCYDQDICIYKPFPISNFKGMIDFSKIKKEAGENQANFFEKVEQEIIGNPYVILELKKGAVQTDTILAYSQKAMSIKSVFPYAQYALVLIGRNAPRLFKHGYAFDKIVQIEEEDVLDKGCKKILEVIRVMLDEAKYRLAGL